MEEEDSGVPFIGQEEDEEDVSSPRFSIRDPLGLESLSSVQAPSYSYSLDDGLHNFIIPISTSNAPYVVQGHSFDVAPTVEFKSKDLSTSGSSAVPSFSLIPLTEKAGVLAGPKLPKARPPPKPSSSGNQALSFKCEWEDCFSDDFDDLSTFLEHVAAHVEDVPIISTKITAQSIDHSGAKELVDDGNKTFGCLWDGCGFETVNSSEMVRHLNFHAFHTNIKSIGDSILKETNIDPCQLSDEERNVLPQLPECDFQCQWSDCEKAVSSEVFLEPIKFYWHVQWHSEEARPNKVQFGKKEPTQKLKTCKWRGCNFKVSTTYRLKDHLKSHSFERLVACPTCGGLFASRSSYLDHCERQVKVPKEKGLRCSYCQKVFPIERLLRAHMRSHINHYQCALCNMTCPSATALNKHISYRHSDERNFFCPFRDEDEGGCDYSAKSQADVNRHMRIVHFGEDRFKCERCPKVFKSKTTLKFHVEKVHDQAEPRYCCHLCKKRFRRGTYLTAHLGSAHDYKWPEGHKKFHYTLDENGLYHVQTMRFESFDLTTTAFEPDES